MNRPNLLDYAGPADRTPTKALPAMIWSLLSAPVGYMLAIIMAIISGELFELSILLLILAPLSGLCIGTWVRISLPRFARPRDRTYANAAIAIPLGWGLLAFVLITTLRGG